MELLLIAVVIGDYAVTSAVRLLKYSETLVKYSKLKVFHGSY